jgi:hypothetical protein
MESQRRPVILLDLNYTLVANSEVKLQPFTKQIEQEIYRGELVDAIRELCVILITARPCTHRTATLDSIRRKTGWAPRAAYFNTLRAPPAVFKQFVLRKEILPAYTPAELLAIESNSATRRMYENNRVQAVTCEQFLSLYPATVASRDS